MFDNTPPSPTDHEVDVLVVGAGPSGLTAAISTVRHGASVLLVEKHAGLAQFPKATGVRPRVMEILRSWDLEQAVLAASQPARLAMRVTPALRIPGAEVSLQLPEESQLRAVSPSRIAVCPQDRLERILLDQLHALGSTTDVRFGHELTELDVLPADAGVRATVIGPRGRMTVRARFVVGADGARSRVRELVGIERIELGSEGDHLGVLFRADLSGLVAQPPHVLTMITAPGLEGMLVATGDDNRWIYDFEWRPNEGERLADWTRDQVIARLRAATGHEKQRLDVIGLFPWDFGASVAVQQRRGPVFLVGDAAHRTTPRGATGMNTGIADGHNLGWKLAWVARGIAGSELLDSYEQERGPVGRANAEASLVSGVGRPPETALAHDFGVQYESSAIGDGRHAGSRAPHAWVRVEGRRASTIDLFDGRLTVITGPEGDVWRTACEELLAAGTPIGCYQLGVDLVDIDGGLEHAYRLGSHGCVLVRPDGYVAWASGRDGATIPAELQSQVARAIGRQSVVIVAA